MELRNKLTDTEMQSIYFCGCYDDIRFFNFIGTKENYDKTVAEYSWCHYASLEEINAFYPYSFSERITRILLGIAKKSEFLGDIVELTRDEFLSAMFISRYDKQGQTMEKKKIDNQFKKNYQRVGKEWMIYNLMIKTIEMCLFQWLLMKKQIILVKQYAVVLLVRGIHLNLLMKLFIINKLFQKCSV